MAHQIRVLNGCLDMHNGNIILRGVIDPRHFNNIQVAPYQRERRSVSKLKDMIVAVKAGTQLPDIEIGVRGANYREREGVFYLDDDCFIIDGLQRLTACERAIAENGEIDVRLGCMFHFNTTEKWERDRFKAVNGGDGGRVAVSPNVLLRNSAEDSISVDALLSMTSNDREFVLRNKISWGQNKGRGELLTALMVLKIIGVLHSHFGPGRSNRYHELYRAMDKTMGIVGTNIWRANVRHFFAVVDQAFGITSIKFVDLSVHMKGGFLKALAEMFSEHSTFWDGTRLKVERLDVDKLRQFPVTDPGIQALVNSGGSSTNPILYHKIVTHMNSGRRRNRLLKWNGQVADGLLSSEAVAADTLPGGDLDVEEGQPAEMAVP